MDFFAEYIQPFLLAILQGITEFLPVSSSGHLVLLNAMMPVDSGMLFDLVLHLATLGSVCAFYRRDIADIFMGCIREIREYLKKPKEGAKTDSDSEDLKKEDATVQKPDDDPKAENSENAGYANLKFVGFLLVSTIITGVIGLCLNDIVETRLRNIIIVGSLLICNSAILWMSQKRGMFKVTDGKLNLKSAIAIGLAQGLAVLPGISRSGSTITVALLLGIEGKDCAKISFLLSIPVILGAIVLHLSDLTEIQSNGIIIIVLAALVAAVVGYISLVLLTRLLQNAKFHRFAPYCLLVGLIAVACGILM